MSYNYRYLDAEDRKYEDTLEYVFMDIALYNIDGSTKEEAEAFFRDNNCDPYIGAVSGLIYYAETEPIAQDYYDDIIDIIRDFYGLYVREYGRNDLFIPFEYIKSLNHLTWAAWVAFVINNDDFKDKVIKIAEEKNLLR